MAESSIILLMSHFADSESKFLSGSLSVNFLRRKKKATAGFIRLRELSRKNTRKITVGIYTVISISGEAFIA